MTYADLKTELGRITQIPFAEAAWQNAPRLHTNYGIYAIDGRYDLSADETHAEKLVEGTVDAFIVTGNGEYETGLVEAALDAAGVKWRYNSKQYEPGTRLTHIEWVFRCLP